MPSPRVPHPTAPRGRRSALLLGAVVFLGDPLLLGVSLLLGPALLLPACGAVQRPDGGSGLLPVGAVAPDLTGTSRDGQRVRLSSVRGQPAVVYFYPMDGTPGCTREACAFRDAFDQYGARSVTIFGVSQDSAASHQRFVEKHGLPFPLVADEDGSVARAYGVPSRIGLSARVTFVIDRTGRVARVFSDVDPGVHAREVLAAIGELR